MSTDHVLADDGDRRGLLRAERLVAMRALAKRVNRKREEELQGCRRRVPLTPAMSRILEHDDEYIPYRRRKLGTKRKQPPMNPGVFSVQRIAQALDTTVGELLGEKPKLLTIAQRRDLRRCVVFLIRLFDLNAPEVRGLDASVTP